MNLPAHLPRSFDPLLIERLPEDARNDLLAWREWLTPLLGMRSGLKKSFEGIAAVTGTNPLTVKGRFLRFRKLGDAGLLERRLAGKTFWAISKTEITPVARSTGLQDLFKRLYEESSRSGKTAHKRLVKMWRQRDADIAAIPEWREFPGWPKLPRGWSYDNFSEYSPSAYETTAARQGRAAAAAHRPTVFSSRVGLYVGSHYLFDDKWHDFFVNQLDTRKHGRPLEVYSLDLFSACKMRWGVRVRTKDAEGKYKGVGEVMTRFVLAATLFLDGYSPRGTTLVTEKGTAKVRGSLAEILANNTGGKIILDEGGMTGAPALLSQYPGLARGNPRHKAALESNNNLEHNRFDYLPGQTGRNVAERPEELSGRLTHNAALLRAYDRLPAAKRDLLEFPVLELNQFLDVATHIYAEIADDRDHKLEGWAEAGLTTQLFEIAGVLVPYSALTAAQQDQLPGLIEAGLVKVQPARMSRREARATGYRDLIKLPGWGVVAILGDDMAREVKVRDNMFQVTDPEIGPGLYRYDAIVRTPEGASAILRDGESYEAFINPFAPDTLFVRDARGGYLGECDRILAPCRSDIEGMQAALAHAVRTEAALLAPSRSRHAGSAEEKRQRHEHNAAVLREEDRAEIEAEDTRSKTATAILNGRGDDEEFDD